MFLLRNFVRAYFPSKLAHRINVVKNLNLRFLEPEMEFVDSFLRRRVGSSPVGVVDVGANLGLYVELCIRTGASVIAIEPLPYLASYLRKIFVGSDVKVVESAVASTDVSSEVTLRVPLNPRLPRKMQDLEQFSTIKDGNSLDMFFSHRDLVVACNTLDQLIDTEFKVDLLKIDVEGAELEVLMGSRAVIGRDHPLILCEIESRRGGNFKDTSDFLLRFGYTCYVWIDHNLMATDSIPDFEVASYSNFIFKVDE
jgi:FkbM family methyltransferase